MKNFFFLLLLTILLQKASAQTGKTNQQNKSDSTNLQKKAAKAQCAISSYSFFVSSDTVCSGAQVTVVFFGASSYTLNPGNIITTSFSLATNPIVNTIYTLTAESGTCIVTNTINITVLSLPSQPTAIIGNTLVPINSVQIYSVSPVVGATSYNWILPGGWTGSSNTNSISTSANTAYTNTFISVSATNSCGIGPNKTLAVNTCTRSTPPSAVIGNTLVLEGSLQTYSTTPVSGAISYNWGFPSGWTGSSSTNTISVFITNLSGAIFVSAINSCASSSYTYLYVTVTSTCVLPGQITAIIGNTLVPANSLQTYSVAPVSNAISYDWYLFPSGISPTTTTNVITINVSDSTEVLAVSAVNNCGTSDNSITIYKVSCNPNAPGAISGNTNVTPTTIETYSIVNDPNASSYVWTLPNGYSGSSTTNTISVTIGNTNGVISVVAQNSCGVSAAATSFVSISSNTTQIAPSAISSAGGRTIVICNDGTLNAWGTDFSGALGNGTGSSVYSPVQVSVLSNVIAIAASDESSIALKGDGSVWTWGSNQYGQLGNGTYNSSNIPIQVTGVSNISAITGGTNYFLALKNDGTVWSWGDNYFGQLGNGTTIKSNVPVQVVGLTNVRALAGGTTGQHCFVFKNDGTIWGWGANFSGQLGNVIANGPSQKVPVQINTLNNVTEISRGEGFTLALKNDGTVLSFGWNSYGELGNGTIVSTSNYSGVPTTIPSLSGVTSIKASYHHAIVLKNDGTAWAWGVNYYGELGNGSNTDSNIPVLVNGLNGVSQISMGDDNTHAIKNDGTVWSWGRNLGNGSLGLFTSSNVPVEVSGVCNGIIGIEESSINHSLSIYPIPTTGSFKIKTETDLKNATIKIHNVQGQVIFESKRFIEEIDLSSQPKGVYFIQIKLEDRIINKKIIVQ